jgi:hypothetical protein
MRGFLALALLLGLAWGQESLEALLVLKEEVIEGGELRTYTGLQRYPVASEAELKALLKKLSRPASSLGKAAGGAWRRRASSLTRRRPSPPTGRPGPRAGRAFACPSATSLPP